MSHNESSTGREGPEQTTDQNRGWDTLKASIDQCSGNDIVDVVQEVCQALAKENAILHDENRRLQSENDTLKAKTLGVNEGVEPSMRGTIPHRLPEQPQEAPGPIKVDDENQYELDQIIACRLFKKKLQYKASWMGYDPDDTWYPARNFKNSPYAIQT